MRVLKVIAWTLGIGAGIYVLFVTLLVSAPYVSNYLNREEFNSGKWKNWEESEDEMSLRWNMVANLEDDYELKGMTTDEILRLLGEPDAKSRNEWTYNLGMSGNGIDTGTLVLTIEDNRIKSFQTYRG